MTQATSQTWELTAGEHVCWRAGSIHEYAAGRDALIAQADQRAGGLLILDGDPPRGVAHELGTSHGPDAALTAVRERVHRARRDGRAPWVLASMEQLTSPDAPVAEVVAIELELAELAADTRTGVVCAYRGALWRPALLGDIAPVHSRVVGITPDVSGFRLRPTGAHGYTLEGSVGFESLRAFTTALRGALLRSPNLQLHCEQLELIDAAAWRAMVETVAAAPGTSVLLKHANETVRAAWLMSGYGDAGVAVQVQS